MPRYKLTLEYDGTGLAGWQRQENGPSVQQFLEEALEKFLRQSVTTYAAGRTDAGVHALGQVAHFDTEKHYPAETVQRAVNFYLKGQPVIVVAAKEVGDEFHARFSAIERSYCYRILSRSAAPVLSANRVWHIRGELDVEAMQKGADMLVGKHDFTSFRAIACQAKSALKTVNAIQIEKKGEEIHLSIRAPSFLHHMVRNITGSLVFVGSGKWQWEHIATILAARNRVVAGPTAPPQGLYFTQVNYPPDCEKL